MLSKNSITKLMLLDATHKYLCKLTPLIRNSMEYKPIRQLGYRIILRKRLHMDWDKNKDNLLQIETFWDIFH